MPYPEAMIPNLTVELPPPGANVVLLESLGVLYPGMVCNMDQTPMPFEFQPLKGRKDSKEVIRDYRQLYKGPSSRRINRIHGVHGKADLSKHENPRDFFVL
jgi:hypothetical protein